MRHSGDKRGGDRMGGGMDRDKKPGMVQFSPSMGGNMSGGDQGRFNPED